nr:transposase [Streptomyces flavochromogenes]
MAPPAGNPSPHRPQGRRVLTAAGLRHRWVVERTVSWLAGCRRLHRRYERKAEHLLAFVGIAATLIGYRRLAALLTA